MASAWSKEVFKDIHKKKQYFWLCVLALLGILLLLLGNQGESAKKQINVPTDTVTSTATQDYTVAEYSLTALEQKLAHTLSQIQGAGAVTVQVTAKSSGRKEYAADTQCTSRTVIEENGESKQQTTEVQEQKTVVQQNRNGAQQALLLEESMPELTGVLIVAAGAADAVVAEQLSRAAAALLQVPLHQIIVLPGEEGL